ncbi:MAG: hypothetical protein ABSC29_03325 [Minisyncoccia bacterium]
MKPQKTIFILTVASFTLALVSPSISFAALATCSDGATMCGFVSHANMWNSTCSLFYWGGYSKGGETCHSAGGDSLPAGWTETATQVGIPAGTWLDPGGYVNIRIYPNTTADVGVAAFDDNGSAQIGTFYYSYNGCTCGPDDVAGSGCGGAGSGNGGSGSAVVNPGDQLVVTVINACKPNGSGKWGGGSAWVDAQSATYCYTAATGLTGGITYTPGSTPGTCDPVGGTNGTITVSSKNSKTDLSVPASWHFTAFPTGNDPCSGHGGSCDNAYQGTYTGLRANNDQYTLPANAATPSDQTQYTLHSIENRDVALHDTHTPSSFALLKNVLSSIPTANAVSISPADTLTLSPSQLTANFIISWDPLAKMAVSPESLSLSPSDTSGQVTITNSGTQGSTLGGLSANVTYISGPSSGWIQESSLSTSLSNISPINQGLSSNVTISTTPPSTAGTYVASIAFKGETTTRRFPFGLSFLHQRRAIGNAHLVKREHNRLHRVECLVRFAINERLHLGLPRRHGQLHLHPDLHRPRRERLE